MDATAEVNVLRTSAARFPRRDLLASKMALKVFSLLVGGTGALTDMGLWMEKNEATLISMRQFHLVSHSSKKSFLSWKWEKHTFHRRILRRRHTWQIQQRRRGLS
jgi:hypothetical protein